MQTYTRRWTFLNGRTLEETKFYVSDDTAIRGTAQAMAKADVGEVAVLVRDGLEVARIQAGAGKALPA